MDPDLRTRDGIEYCCDKLLFFFIFAQADCVLNRVYN